MTNVSFIGIGGMAKAIAGRAVANGVSVELIGRDAAKAKSVADSLGGGTTTGTYGDVPTGDVVVLAVPYTSSVQVATQYADALAGKVVIDISNTFNADTTGVVTPEGTSGAQEIAKVLPASTQVVKAFNTMFGHVLAQGHAIDVFFAGGDAQAKTAVSAFITSLGLRPLDVGGLEMARWLEGAGPIIMGLARHGAGFNIALGVTKFD
jgi:predicted dinucleotide-binding enzyme